MRYAILVFLALAYFALGSAPTESKRQRCLDGAAQALVIAFALLVWRYVP